MKDWVPTIATLAVLTIIQALFGRGVSMWCACIALAFCVGTFWGAGDQMRKQREAKSTDTPA